MSVKNSRSKRKYGRAGRIGHAWPLVGLLVILLAGSMLLIVQPELKRNGLGIQGDPKIKKLIYPTLGNPAITRKGADLVIEYDPRGQQWHRFLPRWLSFNVTARTSNGPVTITEPLKVKSSKLGYSTQWPEYARSDRQDHRIYLVTATVPAHLPTDLYDLEIQARVGFLKWKDSQPHALQAVDAYKNDFTMVQLTDIHVWGPEIDYPTATLHDRGKRPNGKDPARKGAVYYQKAIDQVNLLHPDFCIFSGDYIFGQRYFTQDNGPPWGTTTEYQYEMRWFYEETMRLDVPVFMAMGNHDSYNEGDEAAHEDWFVNWRKMFGPLYHSFDYAGVHFVATNSTDWKASERTLNNIIDLILQPTKYKGQFADGGDTAAEGVTEARYRAIDESKFTGQLAWIRDDLAAHQSAKARVVILHDDPYKLNGSGEMWGLAAGQGTEAELKQLISKVMDMGGGEGRLAIMRLMQDYRVSLALSGHDHSDTVATHSSAAKDLGAGFVDVFTWKGGGGEVNYVNTTSTQFQRVGQSDYYPGYRLIKMVDGQQQGYNYAEPKWSYPFFAGCNIGGSTDLDTLTEPAIRSTVDRTAGDKYAANVILDNTLAVPLAGVYSEVKMPALSGKRYYVVRNGTLAGVYRDPASASVVCQVYSDVPARTSLTVAVDSSDGTDTSAPAVQAVIGSGTGRTPKRAVLLSVKGTDAGGSGLAEMMISNGEDFKGARWRPYKESVAWLLERGSPGSRTVYVKVRDHAGNVSGTARATAYYK